MHDKSQHLVPIKLLSTRCRFMCNIHCYSTHLALVRKGKDVGDGVAIEPHSPELWKSPTMLESSFPPLVSARSTYGLLRMFVSIAGFFNTEIVNWESKRIHPGSMPSVFAYAIMYACCRSVVPPGVRCSTSDTAV